MNITHDIKYDFGIYDINPNLVYFDSASTTLVPKITVNTVTDFLTSIVASSRRSNHKLAVQGRNVVEKTRSALANFMQTKESQISFQKSIPSAIASFAYGYDWQKKGKEKIVIGESEEHSILVSLLRVAQILNLKVEIVAVNKDGHLDMDQLQSAINQETGIVAIGHVTAGLGIQNPVYESAKIAHESEALLITDVTRSIGFTKENLTTLQADLLVFSGNIGLMGPPGLAIQWISKTIEADHRPGILGSSAINRIENEIYSISSSPDKFESGILNIPAIAGLGVSIHYLDQLISHDFLMHMKKLANYMNNRLSEIPNLLVYDSNSTPKTIFGFSILNGTGINCHDIALFLDESNIAVRSGFLCAHPLIKKINPEGIVQVSLHMYNSISDIDYFVDTLESICKQLL
jgi:cysteine desulfurase/selenocysteine lyase